jgi:branched-chain amino acid aminotransferase
MLVYLNGRFVSEERAAVSVFDRGFLFGDGLFETILVRNGNPFRWPQHIERLQRGAQFLEIKMPISPEALRRVAQRLIAKNRMPDSLLRLALTRGIGRRGYSPAGANRPTLVMSLHPAPVEEPSLKRLQWNLITASVRLPAGETLAQFKTCNKLPQILARAEADAAGANEALLLNTDGFVAEGAGSNLFWIQAGALCTPPLADGILAGVTREVVLGLCRSLGVAALERETTPRQLKRCAGAFLTLSSWGIAEAISLDGRRLRRSPLTGKLRAAYGDLVRAETGLGSDASMKR